MAHLLNDGNVQVWRLIALEDDHGINANKKATAMAISLVFRIYILPLQAWMMLIAHGCVPILIEEVPHVDKFLIVPSIPLPFLWCFEKIEDEDRVALYISDQQHPVVFIF